jgi:hypothetical protein
VPPLMAAPRLGRREIKRKALPAFERVFQSPDLHDAPLRPECTGRLLLYPCPGGELTVGQFQAVRLAAAAEGDTCAFLSDTMSLDRISWLDPRRPSWYVPLDSYERYERIIDPAPRLASAFYSPRGSWGILFSDEGDAVVGGSDSFRATFLDALPDPMELLQQHWLGEVNLTMSLVGLLGVKEAVMVEAWLQLWTGYRASGGYVTDWVPGVLEHVYGDKLGAEIVREFGW